MWWLPHKPPADCESHIQQSQLSARQAGRPHFSSLPFLSLPPLLYLSLSLFTFTPLQHDTSVWYIWNICLVPLKLIWMVEVNPSFSQSSHGQTIVETQDISCCYTLLCSLWLQKTLLCVLVQFKNIFLQIGLPYALMYNLKTFKFIWSININRGIVISQNVQLLLYMLCTLGTFSPVICIAFKSTSSKCKLM